VLTVLQVVPEMSAGGVERTTLDIATALRATGAQALVATKGGRMVKHLIAAGAEVIEGPFDSKNPMTIWRNAGVLARIVRDRKVDIIHARSRAPAWSAKWAAERTGAKFITTYAGIYNARNPLKRWYNSVMAQGDIVIANSQYTARHIRHAFPHLRRPIAIIPRGIDLRNFDPQAVTPEAVASLRAKWTIPDGVKAVLMPGRLTRWKGSLVFVDAMAQLKHLGVYGILAGDAQSRNSFEDEVLARIAKLGLMGQVRYVGHQDDMALAYAAADVVVSASLEPEAFGRVAVEAQAMRRLIVATDLGAARETVLPDQSGWLVPPEDPRAMAEAIADALNLDPFEAEAMRDRGRAHVMRKFNVTTMCRHTLQVYGKVLGQRPMARAAE
jgi:glycosyltransferase involved in cell wall biosynthesis